jgi:hypothetical protein
MKHPRACRCVCGETIATNTTPAWTRTETTPKKKQQKKQKNVAARPQIDAAKRRLDVDREPGGVSGERRVGDK